MEKQTFKNLVEVLKKGVLRAAPWDHASDNQSPWSGCRTHWNCIFVPLILHNQLCLCNISYPCYKSVANQTLYFFSYGCHSTWFVYFFQSTKVYGSIVKIQQFCALGFEKWPIKLTQRETVFRISRKTFFFKLWHLYNKGN